MYPLFQLASQGILPDFNPASRISLIHVEDLVEGVAAAARKARLGETYFLTHQEPVNAKVLPRIMGEALGRRVRAFNVPVGLLRAGALASETWGRLTGDMPVFNRNKVRELAAEGLACDWEKAYREFGFRAVRGLPEGLKETVKWYREQGWL